MHTDNKGAATGGVIDFGGMLTFLAICGNDQRQRRAGHERREPVAQPEQRLGGGDRLSALDRTLADWRRPLTGAEYFVDTLGASGAGCPSPRASARHRPASAVPSR